MKSVVLKVNGMSCQHCVNSIHDAVAQIVGVKQVKVDLKSKLVEVEYENLTPVEVSPNSVSNDEKKKNY